MFPNKEIQEISGSYSNLITMVAITMVTSFLSSSLRQGGGGHYTVTKDTKLDCDDSIIGTYTRVHKAVRVRTTR